MISTDINYPAELPYPTTQGYGLQTTQTFVRTDMGSGRARQRRLFSNVPTTASVVWLFTSDMDAALFESWFRDQTNDGVEWFNCPLKTPVGVKQYVCRFTTMYEGPILAGICAWQIRANLEIYERPILPDGWGNAPDWLTNWSKFDVLMNHVWPLDR